MQATAHRLVYMPISKDRSLDWKTEEGETKRDGSLCGYVQVKNFVQQ